jgi:uroporphyrin-III C-methyltransferase
MSGVVHLVGAGPGAIDLLTVRAVRLLESADVVFYDALVQDDVLALAARAEKIAVGKRCGRHSTAQAFINKRLVDAAARYETVVRLKGGDPMLFGRAQEEIDALRKAGVRVEIVPGITAASAASAALQTSLTRRGVSRNVVLVTPRVGESEKPHDWIASASSADTAVVYMGSREAALLATRLVERGASPDLPVAIVESATTPRERRVFGTLSSLGELAESLGGGPAIIVVGEVLREAVAASAAAGAADEAPVRKAS